MNANTRLRLAKETRALLPLWVATAAWITLPFLLPVNDPLPYALTGFLFGCAVLGPACVGHEFTHGTMGMLLTQPAPRRQLWREKLAVAGAAVVSLSLLLVLLIQCKRTTGLEEVIRRAAEDDPLRAALFVAVPVLVPLMAFCTGPALTLFARNALGGAALTFICPFFLMVAGVIVVSGVWDFTPAVEEQFLLSYALLVGSIYSGGLFLHGCRRFERLEDVSTLAQEFAPPHQFSALFSGLTLRLAPDRHSPTANLLRKELRLQQPAFLVAAFLVALWLAFIVVWRIHSAVDAEIMMVPAILLCLGIPVIAGIVSTAEERSLGVHEWHLTLPVSARRLWTVKVLVALGVNVMLGILLPGVLGQASSWIAEDKQMLADIPRGGVPHFLIANLVIFCAALYASTASANSMRALIGTIVLFLAGAMVLNFADFVVHSFSRTGATGPAHEWPSDPSALVVWLYRTRWPLVWGGFAVWLFVLGLTSFRHSLESVWQPVRRMAVFFAVVCAFVFAAIIW